MELAELVVCNLKRRDKRLLDVIDEEWMKETSKGRITRIGDHFDFGRI
jgi:hypothetical protein